MEVGRVEADLASYAAACLDGPYVEDMNIAQGGLYTAAVQGISVDASVHPFEVEEFFSSFPSRLKLPAQYPITNPYHLVHTS